MPPDRCSTLTRNGARAIRARRRDHRRARGRAAPPDRWAGLIVRLDGDAPQDRTPACDRNADPLCAGDPVFNFYSVEVVQRIGYDSFTPDNGVLLAKNKDKQVELVRLQLLTLGDRRASRRHQAARLRRGRTASASCGRSPTTGS